MRRLPVFFVLDCSESMAGDNLAKMEQGIGMIIRNLRQDPYALETACLSVIAFAGIAKTIAPLVEVASFYPPRLPLGGGTALGAALTELMKQIDAQVVRSSPDRKGDWKPIVYLLTDGKPTDKMEFALKRWRSEYADRATIIAIAVGRYADIAALQQITDTVLLFEEQTEDDFKKFISWISSSISFQSKSVTEGQPEGALLPGTGGNVVSLLKHDNLPHLFTDQDCVVLTGRCQNTGKAYLMKYDRLQNVVQLRKDRQGAKHYRLTGCYTLSEEYFEWSSHGAEHALVNTDDLIGTPGCPYCGNGSAFAMCGCGKLMCIDGPGDAACPWCKAEVSFSGSGQDFDVRRGRG